MTGHTPAKSYPGAAQASHKAPSKRPLRLRLLPIYVRLESMNAHATGLACPQTLSSTIFGRGQVVSGNRACTLGLLSLLLAIGCRA